MKMTPLLLPLLAVSLLASCNQAAQPQAQSASTKPPASAIAVQSIAPAGGRLLLMGQSNRSAWDDLTSFAGAPDGGSVYYSVKYNNFVGQSHRDYAAFLADQGKVVQIGVSWKDDPPLPGANGEGSRQSTLAVADGRLDRQFDSLITFINAHRTGRYLLRLDYEVNPFYHCTDATCSSYKNAFNHLATLIRGRTPGVAVEYVFHPVRGAQAQMYPGDANTNWIGVSVFNHDLCLPLYAVNTTQYNGTPGSGFDVQNNLCKGYYNKIVNGNANAAPYSWPIDLNDLAMMLFAKNHGKPMIVSESSPQNFVAGEGPGGREPEALVSTWLDRLFQMVRYSGPVPNQTGTYDLSGVIKAVTYINVDWRYGFDGATSGPKSGTFDDVWWANSRLSGFSQARTTFCNGLAQNGFTVRCGGGGSLPTGVVSIRNINSGKCLDIAGNAADNLTNGASLIQNTCTSSATQRFTLIATDAGYYRIVSQRSGRSLEVSGGASETQSGAKVGQWDYWSGTNQQWKPVAVSAGSYKLLARHSGQVMDVPGCDRRDNATLQQWTDFSTACQQFSFQTP